MRLTVARIHLDTNVLIGALVAGSPADRLLRYRLLGGDVLGVSAMAWGEFCCGSPGATPPEATRRLLRQLVGEPVALDAEGAELAASLFNGSGRRRGSFGDCLVAATALRADAALATANVADFEPLVGLGLQVIGV